MIDYHNNGYTAKQWQAHLFDGIVVKVHTPISYRAYAVLHLKVGGHEYSEKHFLYNGDTEFNISEYIKEALPLDYARLLYTIEKSSILPSPIRSTKNDGMAVTDNYVVEKMEIEITEENGEVINTMTLLPASLDCIYGYTTTDDEEPALHLFNPNYECVAEYHPNNANDPNTQFGLCFNKNNGNQTDWYTYGNNPLLRILQGVKPLYQVRLNDYWDERYNSDGIVLDFVTNNGSDSAQYLVDTRTSGCFVRFLDSEGRLQQILLDLEGQENAYNDGDLVVYHQGGTRHYEPYRNAEVSTSHAQTAKRVHTQALHCSISNMPKALVRDLKALAISPVVLLNRGGNKWEQVRVVPEAIVTETKKSLVSARFDIYPMYENTYGI